MLYVHRDGVGRRGYLGRMRFNPKTHNIGHLKEVIRATYGPGSYWLRTQSKTGSGYGPGSAMLDLDDPTPIATMPEAHPPAAPAPAAPMVQVLPPQNAVDVNAQLLVGLIKELVGKMGGAGPGLDINQLSGAIQSALSSQQASVQALTSARDPANQAFASAREILKMTRELGGQVAAGDNGGGDMMPMMMMMMMMNGGGGNMAQMMPMMMMMNQGQGGGGNMSQMMPMMMMMMNQGQGGGGPPRPGPAQLQRPPQTGGGAADPMQMMQMMQMMQAMQRQPEAPAAGPWGPIGVTPAAPSPAPARAPAPAPAPAPAAAPAAAPRAANSLQLDGYGGGLDFDMMASMAGISTAQLHMGLETMTEEERQSFFVMAKNLNPPEAVDG